MGARGRFIVTGRVLVVQMLRVILSLAVCEL